jgi:hypothetical protein
VAVICLQDCGAARAKASALPRDSARAVDHSILFGASKMPAIAATNAGMAAPESIVSSSSCNLGLFVLIANPPVVLIGLAVYRR